VVAYVGRGKLSTEKPVLRPETSVSFGMKISTRNTVLNLSVMDIFHAKQNEMDSFSQFLTREASAKLGYPVRLEEFAIVSMRDNGSVNINVRVSKV